MSTRKIVLLMLAVIFTLSALSVAAIPGAESNPAVTKGTSFAAIQFELQPPNYPYCPGPDDPGCGGDD